MSQITEQVVPINFQATNGSSKPENLPTLVQSLQEECARLRESLSKAEKERDQYLEALYEKIRPTLHFEDVDLDELKKVAVGPIEKIN